MPTAYPSRRAWLHLMVRDSKGQLVFESGALNHDGSIRGNANDEDPLRYEPHYSEITRPDQVERSGISERQSAAAFRLR